MFKPAPLKDDDTVDPDIKSRQSEEVSNQDNIYYTRIRHSFVPKTKLTVLDRLKLLWFCIRD